MPVNGDDDEGVPEEGSEDDDAEDEPLEDEEQGVFPVVVGRGRRRQGGVEFLQKCRLRAAPACVYLAAQRSIWGEKICVVEVFSCLCKEGCKKTLPWSST